MNDSHEILLVEFLSEANPPESILLREGLVCLDAILEGKSKDTSRHDLSFGASDVVTWLAPPALATITWFFAIGQEVVRNRVKRRLEKILDSDGEKHEFHQAVLLIRNKYVDECVKRKINAKKAEESADILVNVLLKNKDLIS